MHLPALQTIAGDRVSKTIEFDHEMFTALQELRRRTRRSNFSETVRLAIRHGIAAIEQLEAEGRLVA